MTDKDSVNSESNVCFDAANKIDMLINDDSVLVKAAIDYATEQGCTAAIQSIFDIRTQVLRIKRKSS